MPESSSPESPSAKLGALLSAPKNNLVHNMGRVAFLSFVIALISGIYLFIFYEIDPHKAYESTQAISDQLIGGVMRSLHRYSSDMLILALLWHALHRLLFGHYRRRFMWLTGLISLVVIILIGLTGFVLVWDQKAKLTGILSAQLVTALPLFNPSLTGLFISDNLSALSGIFRISFVGHFLLSVIILVLIYVHITRRGRSRLMPSKAIIWFVSTVLIAMSVAFPVSSDLPAEVSILPVYSRFDWFYFLGLYPLSFMSATAVWMLFLGVLVVLVGITYRRPPSSTDATKKQARRTVMRRYLNISFLVAFAGIPYLSDTKTNVFTPDKDVVILNFNYTSSPTEVETIGSNLAHMKTDIPVVKKRAPIAVWLTDNNGNTVFKRSYKPSGFRSNAAISIYEEISTSGELQLHISEEVTPKVMHVSQSFTSSGATHVAWFEGRFRVRRDTVSYTY